MPALNFQARFKESVRSGSKRQTIRARGKRSPPKVGDTLYLYSGLRTKNVSHLGEVTCRRVSQLSISVRNRTVQAINLEANMWVTMTADEVEKLAQADGFSGADEFFAWVQENHGSTLSGFLIEW